MQHEAQFTLLAVEAVRHPYRLEGIKYDSWSHANFNMFVSQVCAVKYKRLRMAKFQYTYPEKNICGERVFSLAKYFFLVYD